MPIDIRNDVLLAPLTTLGLGGAARHLITISSVDDLREALEWVRQKKLPFYVLGGGSNTIFADSGYNGVVLHIGMKGLRRDGTVLTVQAGEGWDDVVHQSVQMGLGGLECLSGIPGQAGATPVQNVGAYGQEVGSTIVSVTGIHVPTGEVQTLSAEDCRFSYRSSVFKAGYPLIITKVVYRLSEASSLEPTYPELRQAYAQALNARAASTVGEGAGSDVDGKTSRWEALSLLRQVVLDIRRRKSMVFDVGDPDSRSAGSFFTNPVLSRAEFDIARLRAEGLGLTLPAYPSGATVKLSAAWLVEQAGFERGYTKNGVGVSKAHSLSLVNRGGTAEALLALAAEITDGVWNTFGVRLEREPVFVENGSIRVDSSPPA